MAMSPSMSSASGAGGMLGADPTAGADPMAGSGAGAGSSETTEVTITSTADGSYMVYAGAAPADGGGDMSADDASAMGGAAGAGAGGGMAGGASGQPADSIGAALKLAMDILKGNQSSAGAPGTADDQLSAGYSSSKAPTPATGGPGQKY